MMNLRHFSYVCALLGLLAGSVAGATSPGCADARFSAEVLDRFPRAPEVCLDVISRGGQDYAVFKAQLERVSGNTLNLRFKLPDGTRGAPIKIATRREFRVLIDGKPTPVSDLAPGQELTAYVQVDKPLVALAPASEREALQFVPLPDRTNEPPLASASRGPVMPETASPRAAVGWLGQLFLWTALGLTLIRRRCS